MVKAWLKKVFSTHRDLWRGVEFTGSDMASTGGRMVRRRSCRVNRQKISNYLQVAPLRNLRHLLELLHTKAGHHDECLKKE